MEEIMSFLASDWFTKEDEEFCVRIRREIHEYPEVGFDLPRTAGIVKRELDAIGVPYTEKFAQCSVVGVIGGKLSDITAPEAKTRPILCYRADMDALPVTEKVDVPFKSKVEGKMHACGHDSHTAMLLTVARILKRHEAELPVTVELLFQPSEECEISGAKEMAKNGAVNAADFVMCLHVDNEILSGHIGVCAGEYMTACCPITIEFFGKTAHATMPEKGIDTIAMTLESCEKMKKVVEEEAAKFDAVKIFAIDYIHGGTAHNVIADYTAMKISFRYYNQEFADSVREKCLAICEEAAKSRGGSMKADWQMSAPALYNDGPLTAYLKSCAEKVAPVDTMPRRLSTEDFAWFTQKKRGTLFRLGTGNDEKGCNTVAHCNDFKIDEDAFPNAVKTIVQIMMDFGEFRDE